MKEYKLQYDNFFVDDLTVELLRKNLRCINGFIDKDGNSISVKEFKMIIAKRITDSKEGIQWNYRSCTGRFEKNNSYAEKLKCDKDMVYMLYLLCNSIQETADLLGVCRQTVSKRIRQYKKDK